MYGIYANKTGVFLDGKCYHIYHIYHTWILWAIVNGVYKPTNITWGAPPSWASLGHLFPVISCWKGPDPLHRASKWLRRVHVAPLLENQPARFLTGNVGSHFSPTKIWGISIKSLYDYIISAQIWRFPEMRVPPVIIHFKRILHNKNLFWGTHGYAHLWKPSYRQS